jgi:alpha-mannosidase
MHDDRALVEARLDRVLRERIRPAVHGRSAPLEVAVWHAPGEPVEPIEAIAADYRPGAVGDEWGPAWGTTWFRLSGRVPREWAGCVVDAVIDLGFGGEQPGFSAEGLVYWPDATAIKGVHPRNTTVRLRSGIDPVLLYVEAAANPLIAGPVTRFGDGPMPGGRPLYRLTRAELAVFEPAVSELALDLEVLGGLMRELGTGDPRRWEVLRAIERALDALDLADVSGTAATARAHLAPALAAPAHASALRVSAVGHAHIDSAWLWPLRETVRKVARTAANVVALMDEHPEFVFAMSQAQQLEWLADRRPDVYARVREKVAGGRFVPVGGMWVEADTNMPGGEAMARQFVYGKRFFLERFGIETEEVWLPDSFGYSAALPQLVKLSGSRWFFSHKLSWNQTNRFPHHTFYWEGIDGTRIFTHFTPADTYNAELTGAELAHLVANFAEKGAASRSLVAFGYGDGGGGPTAEMLARARRLADLEGSARVTIESPAAFFAAAEAEYPNAPVWAGELYLESHRGTYTSQAGNKQGNRRAEHLLRGAELWAATAAVRAAYDYPYQRLDRLWKTVLLHQFHDILPGSSIAWVHREARATYARVFAELEEIIAGAQRVLAGDPGSGRTVVFNAAPHARGGVPAGAAVVDPQQSGDEVRVSRAEDGGWILDNGLLRVIVDGRGLITSAVDLATDRDAVAPGRAANLLQVHPDLPNNWDAWDVDSFYRNTRTDLTDAKEVSLAAVDRSHARITVTRTHSRSTFHQTIGLSAGARRVDIDTEVDWQETETFLKLAFPLDVHTDRSAAETQFGHVMRPTHTNTSWDAARFETCAHRWVHLGEAGWGAAVASDSTYGYDVVREVRDRGSGVITTLRLSLLRAPRFPDPETDQGVHGFRHALVPGADILDAVREGYRINLPERQVPGDRPVRALVEVDRDDVVIEAVKLADDRSGDVVVRLYEARGGHADGHLRFGFGVRSVQETDLLERPLAGAPDYRVRDDSVPLRLRPFQILTLRLERV